MFSLLRSPPAMSRVKDRELYKDFLSWAMKEDNVRAQDQ